MSGVRVRILHNGECPHLDLTVERVMRVFGVRDPETIQVGTLDEAVRLRFLGSPTVQIDGRDVDPSARQRSDFTLGCRLYDGSGCPSEELLSAALDAP